jgi:hypothetical protein
MRCEFFIAFLGIAGDANGASAEPMEAVVAL